MVLVRGHLRLPRFLHLRLRILLLWLLGRLQLLLILVLEEGFTRDARHDEVVLVLLLAAEHPSALVETLHATLGVIFRRMLAALLLLLVVHDLLYLVLHLHDCIHHGQLC